MNIVEKILNKKPSFMNLVCIIVAIVLLATVLFNKSWVLFIIALIIGIIGLLYDGKKVIKTILLLNHEGVFISLLLVLEEIFCSIGHIIYSLSIPLL